MPHFDPIMILQILPALIIGLTIHEFAHAYAAYLCGDSTSKDLGRVSLNPIKHIDPIGFFLIIFAGFGWAKPVSFNEYNLRNRDRDTIIIALAGPLSNALLAIVLSAIFVFLVSTVPGSTLMSYEFFIKMLYFGIFINWGLFVFNMFPIPPLDGSHVFLSGCKNHPSYQMLQKYGMIGLIIILIIQSGGGPQILPVALFTQHIGNFFLQLFGY